MLTVETFKPLTFGISFIAMVFMIAGLLYFSTKDRAHELVGSLHYNTVDGQYKSFTLPDGSKGKLHVNSSVAFPRISSSDKRTAKFSGGAYLDVKKSDKPLIIETDNSEIKTHRSIVNIADYAKGTAVLISVKEGEVEATFKKKNNETETVTIKANQRCLFNKYSEEIENKEVSDIEKDFHWIDDLIIFEKTPLREVFNTLERRYSVRFVIYNHPILDSTYTAKYEKAGLDDILQDLQKKVYFGYTNNGREIAITD